MRFMLLFMFLCQFAAADPIECRRLVGKITLDGIANELDWQVAKEVADFRMAWDGDRRPKTGTRARLLWDDRFLYFFAEMDDGDLFADIVEADGDTWLNDVFEIFLKPSAAKEPYYEFHVSAANTHFDIHLPKPGGAEQINRLRRARPFHMESMVKRRGTLNERGDRDLGWSVEGRIPWKDFAPTGGKPKVGDEWRVALCRYDYDIKQKRPELSSTAPYKVLDFHRTQDFAPMKFVGAGEGAFGPLRRTEWVGGKLAGTPDSPLSYITEKVWPGLAVKKPLEMKRLPGTKGFLVYADHREEKDSISKLWVFRDTPKAAEQFESLSLTNRLIYGFCFHPKFEQNGFVFLHTNGPRRGEGSKAKNCLVSRWTMNRKTHRIDPASRKVIIQWNSNGHDGGGVIFGKDGMLYLTTGDGTSDSDEDVTGQRIDLLLAKVLRIDVDKPTGARPYGIPPDNPFIKAPNAAPETWALGFRNPWRLTCDERTGAIWVGENGQDLWESVKRVERGANYGWSLYEGSHPFYLERKLGPGKLTKPTFEHHHRESRSLTGGIVYYGDKLPKLAGAYIYGDYSTGKIWAGKHDGKKVTWHAEIADTVFGITGFATDTRGNLLVIDDHSGFHRLKPNPATGTPSNFPRRLSGTGLFANTAKHETAPGVMGYSINVPHWTDGATAAHYFALPTKGQLRFGGNRGWQGPDGTALMQTLSRDGKRIETRVLLKQHNEWLGYSYEWNKAQTDATLVGRAGTDLVLANGKPWRIPSRAECMMCHGRAAGYVLSLTELQLNRTHDYGEVKANQIQVLSRLGLVSGARAENYNVGGKSANNRFTNPYDAKAKRTVRVRAYWQVNCATCHVNSGGGNAQMLLSHHLTLDATKTLDAQPVHARFGLGDKARIIAPGDPAHSVMLQRIIRPGPGRMPPIGAIAPDPQWIQLLAEWIAEQKRSK
jgi:glucose/arabinose dehydrogenase